jgi:hypothetical protein
MNKIKSFFNRLVKLFSNETAEALLSILEFLSPYVNKAYPIVKKIAELTPTRIDDEILVAYDYFGFKDVFDPNIDKVEALRNLARLVLKKESKEPIKDHVVNTAIELAYSQYKKQG